MMFDVEHNGVPNQMIQAKVGVDNYFDRVYSRGGELLEEYAPEDSKELKNSFYGEPRADGYDLYNSTDQAGWLQTGTGEYGPHNHPIVPTDSYALKFPWDKMGGAMTVWRGGLGPAGQAEFFEWGESIGAIPFVVWPKGMPKNEFHEDAGSQTESEAQYSGWLEEELDKSGAK